jgi:predicted PurR-regulated permease PerM
MTISDTTAADRNFQKNAMASFVQIAALVILAVWCLRIIAPFVSIILWGMIIAVALYPLHMSLAGKLGGQEKLSATLFVLLGLTILLVPTYILTDSSVTALRTVGTQLNSGAVSINPPDESVAEWPVIGKRVHEIWSDAASNLEATINKFGDQLEQLGGTVLPQKAAAARA